MSASPNGAPLNRRSPSIVSILNNPDHDPQPYYSDQDYFGSTATEATEGLFQRNPSPSPVSNPAAPPPSKSHKRPRTAATPPPPGSMEPPTSRIRRSSSSAEVAAGAPSTASPGPGSLPPAAAPPPPPPPPRNAPPPPPPPPAAATASKTPRKPPPPPARAANLPLEPSIFNVEPIDEFTREVADWLWGFTQHLEWDKVEVCAHLRKSWEWGKLIRTM